MTDREQPGLRSRLAKKELLVAPGVFDGISAKISSGDNVSASERLILGMLSSPFDLSQVRRHFRPTIQSYQSDAAYERLVAVSHSCPRIRHVFLNVYLLNCSA